MTQTQIRRSYRRARRVGKQGERPANSARYAVEKPVTELNIPLLKCKRHIFIATLNVRTLSNKAQIGELVASAVKHNTDIICLQEHRIVHEDILLKYHDVGKNWTLVTSSAWRNSSNAAVGGVGILLSPRAQKALNNIETITPRIMITSFNGNPKATVISCYSYTNVHDDEEDVKTFYETLTSLIRQVPKHNVLFLGGDFNAKLGQVDGHKFSFHATTNRNGIHLDNFLKENKLICLNTKYQRRSGQLWTHTYPNGVKAQLAYIIINSKWINSALNCRAYNTFENVNTDHRIVATKF